LSQQVENQAVALSTILVKIGKDVKLELIKGKRFPEILLSSILERWSIGVPNLAALASRNRKSSLLLPFEAIAIME
jgi:hypothetical protein